MHDFTRLDVWQRARKLIVVVYELTRSFPRTEVFGLTQQMRRSAASIGANLAEGAGRATAPDFARFITMSIGSLSELENHAFTTADLGYISQGNLASVRGEIRQIRAMALALRRSLGDRR